MAKAYYNRGILYTKRGQFKLAIDDFVAASKLQPNYLYCYVRLEQVYRKMGNPLMEKKYHDLWHDKIHDLTDEQEIAFGVAGDAAIKPKAPEIQPLAVLDPLGKAKRELQKKLDATVER